MDAKLPAPRRPRILLMDLDNCPDQLSWLAEELPKFERVVACHGPVEPKLPLSLVKDLATAIHVGQLEFVRMEHGGKNAADFGLAFVAGQLAAQLPEEAEFVILSKDTGLDHVVEMLKRADRQAQRVTGRPSATQSPVRSRPAKAASAVEAAEEFWLVQLSQQQSPPRRKEALRNAIRSYFGRRSRVDCDAVIAELVVRGMVTFNGHGVATYHFPVTDELDDEGLGEEPAPAFRDDDPIPF
jgi:hypothetical protein